jgi:hypothetical protein
VISTNRCCSNNLSGHDAPRTLRQDPHLEPTATRTALRPVRRVFRGGTLGAELAQLQPGFDQTAHPASHSFTQDATALPQRVERANGTCGRLIRPSDDRLVAALRLELWNRRVGEERDGRTRPAVGNRSSLSTWRPFPVWVQLAFDLPVVVEDDEHNRAVCGVAVADGLQLVIVSWIEILVALDRQVSGCSGVPCSQE